MGGRVRTELTCPTCGAKAMPRTSRQVTCGSTECRRALHNERRRERYRTSPEEREARRQERRVFYRRNREAELRYQRQRNYGMRDEQFLALLTAQDGRCPICLEPLLWPRVAVDHCHDSGRVRGLLHGVCNSGVGLLGDDPERCTRAAAYLRAARLSSGGETA